MKKIATVLLMSLVAFASQASASSCGTDKLCVPGDFPAPHGANFNMNLLGENVNFHIPIALPNQQASVPPSVMGRQTPFNPSAFTPRRLPTQPQVPLEPRHSLIRTLPTIHWAQSICFGFTGDFYLQRTGFGNLMDIDGTKGERVPERALVRDMEQHPIQLRQRATQHFKHTYV